MQSITTMHELYQNISQVIESGCKQVKYDVFATMQTMLIIVPKDVTRYYTFREDVAKYNKYGKKIIIAQPHSASFLEKQLTESELLIVWEGSYTRSVFDKVSKFVPEREIDTFVYFSGKPLNMRNANILDLAAHLSGNTAGECKAYTVAADYKLYQYKDIIRLNAAYMVYQNMNLLLEGDV